MCTAFPNTKKEIILFLNFFSNTLFSQILNNFMCILLKCINEMSVKQISCNNTFLFI